MAKHTLSNFKVTPLSSLSPLFTLLRLLPLNQSVCFYSSSFLHNRPSPVLPSSSFTSLSSSPFFSPPSKTVLKLTTISRTRHSWNFLHFLTQLTYMAKQYMLPFLLLLWTLALPRWPPSAKRPDHSKNYFWHYVGGDDVARFGSDDVARGLIDMWTRCILLYVYWY